ncbi:MAG: DUF2399 domain-containing protein [Proteobacteria bacterium]|nr:DUF2399 domain-containing protein [Pseudomonadota bacterium]
MSRIEVPDGPDRRWVRGDGGKTSSVNALALLKYARGKTKNWSKSATTTGPHKLDQVAVEQMLFELLDAGLIEIHEHRNRRGDFFPYQWRLSPAGARWLDETEPAENIVKLIETYLNSGKADRNHPVLDSIRLWLKTQGRPNERAAKISMAIGEALRESRIPLERTVSLRAFGNTKTVRLSNYPRQIEAALGFPPEQVVRRPGHAVYVYGPFEFDIGDHTIDGLWSRPWLALTRETIDSLKQIQVRGCELMTVENLTAFEEAVRSGLPEKTVALYTGGFPGSAESHVMQLLIRGGVKSVLHWGDLDLGGLRIFKYLSESLPVPVRSFRMEPELLDVLPTTKLTDRDCDGLESWLKQKNPLLIELAEAMLNKGCKAEQEGWFLSFGLR